MHKPTLMLLLAGASVIGTAHAEDKLSLQTMQYREDGARVDVDYTTLGLEKDFGTDYTLKLDYGYDAISGATPVWQAHRGVAGEFIESRQRLPDEVRHSYAAALTVRDTARHEYSVGAALSDEPDFVSRELSLGMLRWHDELHNRSYNLGLALQRNTAIANAVSNNRRNEDSEVINVQLGVNQVLDAHSTLELAAYGAREDGYLSNHYLKIVRLQADGSKQLAADARPNQRDSGGVTARWQRELAPGLAANLWYRYYRDSWAIQAHTVEAKLYWDATAWLRINPVYRLQRQGAANFYRAYHGNPNQFAADGNGSNDARLGAYRAQTAQLNLEFRPYKAHSVNVGFSHYWQSNGFAAKWLSAGYQWKF